MSDREDARRAAREDCARELKKHSEMTGKPMSYETAHRTICERADVQDKRRDWGEHKKGKS
jgi:hypothetical protein